MHTAYDTESADHTTLHTKPAPDPHQSAVRRMCHIYRAGLPPQCLVVLQFRNRLCIDTRNVQQPIMPGFRSQVCRLLMREAELGGTLRPVIGELAKVIVKAIHAAAVKAGPERRLGNAGASSSGHLDVVIRRPTDHVAVRFDVTHS